MSRTGRKRLSVEIPTVLHDELKKISIAHHCTITMVALRFLVEKAIAERQRYESDTAPRSCNRDLSDLLNFQRKSIVYSVRVRGPVIDGMGVRRYMKIFFSLIMVTLILAACMCYFDDGKGALKKNLKDDEDFCYRWSR